MHFPRSNPWLYFDEIKALPPDQRQHVINVAARECRIMRRAFPLLVWLLLTAYFNVLIDSITRPTIHSPGLANLAPNEGVWNFSSPVWWFAAFKLSIYMSILVGVPTLLALAMRNKILRESIDAVLAHSELCHECKYPLVGVPINERGEEICPECGMINIPPPRPRPPTPPSHCPACRYALAGLTPTVSDAILCPECGTVVPLEPESTLIAPSPKQPADNNPTHP
ncbi:MAG: hypothetical protein IPK69_13375 [Phycisphaerales bacterium]|nr:MAG: hypothetical protein IPK69_13375 [Phycisphaerales bacterium]